MESSKHSLSIVLPCFNEAESIPRVIRKLENFRHKYRSLFSSIEIIVVDDSSTDGSAALIKNNLEINYSQNPCRLGYGATLKRGFTIATGDYIAFMDMDFSYDPDDLSRMYSELLTGGFQVVSGNRIHSRSEMTFVRKIGNITYSMLLALTLRSPVKDVCTGLRIFPKSLKPIFLSSEEDGLNYSLAMTAKCINLGIRLGEIKIKYNSRIGRSKLNIVTDGFAFLACVFKNRSVFPAKFPPRIAQKSRD